MQLCSYRYALPRKQGVNQKADRARQIIRTLTEFQPASKPAKAPLPITHDVIVNPENSCLPIMARVR